MTTATGRDAYIIKHTLIDLRKDQYVIKNAYRRPITLTKITRSKHFIRLDGDVSIAKDGTLFTSGITLIDPAVCSALLCNYSRLKEDSWGNFESDTWFLIQDFERICDIALREHPLYMRIVECKIDGMQNIDIQKTLESELIAEAATDDFLYWHYLQEEKGKFKRCSRCGEVKLAHNKYFSKNKTSKDGFYSICKACRNAKSRKSATGQKSIVSYI